MAVLIQNDSTLTGPSPSPCYPSPLHSKGLISKSVRHATAGWSFRALAYGRLCNVVVRPKSQRAVSWPIKVGLRVTLRMSGLRPAVVVGSTPRWGGNRGRIFPERNRDPVPYEVRRVSECRGKLLARSQLAIDGADGSCHNRKMGSSAPTMRATFTETPKVP